MRFYTTTHQYYCGIDLHARVMYLCIISSDGDVVLHKNMKAEPESLLKAIQPYRDDVRLELNAFLHGNGSPTSAQKKGSLSFSDMLCT